jgi:hypothetical protein
MGIPLEIYSLYRLQSEGAGCNHYLLLRVEQPGFNNADEGEYEHVIEIADGKRNVLIERYKAEVLLRECAQSHVMSLVGELQAPPIGGDLFEKHRGCYVELWVAETRFGYPWVMMGIAENEAAFWREVEQDEELLSLGASRPARKYWAYFLSEEDQKIRQ